MGRCFGELVWGYKGETLHTEQKGEIMKRYRTWLVAGMVVAMLGACADDPGTDPDGTNTTDPVLTTLPTETTMPSETTTTVAN